MEILECWRMAVKSRKMQIDSRIDNCFRLKVQRSCRTDPLLEA